MARSSRPPARPRRRIDVKRAVQQSIPPSFPATLRKARHGRSRPTRSNRFPHERVPPPDLRNAAEASNHWLKLLGELIDEIAAFREHLAKYPTHGPYASWELQREIDHWRRAPSIDEKTHLGLLVEWSGPRREWWFEVNRVFIAITEYKPRFYEKDFYEMLDHARTIEELRYLTAVVRQLFAFPGILHFDLIAKLQGPMTAPPTPYHYHDERVRRYLSAIAEKRREIEKSSNRTPKP